MLESRNVFTSREPRNAAEIDTCLAMLEDGPFWDAAHYSLDRAECTAVWEELLTSGCGHIDVVENEALVPEIETYRRHNGVPRYKHSFYVIFLVCYVTFDFAREIIMREDIPDVLMHFMNAAVRHRGDTSLPSPAMSAAEVQLGLTQVPGHGLYRFVVPVTHPALDLATVLVSSPQLIERIRRSSHQVESGLMHEAWISNVASVFSKYGFLQFGNRLLREYPGNEDRSQDNKKYIFCLTRNREVSDALGGSGGCRGECGR